VQAGLRSEALVSIGPGKVATQIVASGSVGSARASADGVQEIGCKLEAGSTSVAVRCTAANATARAQCFSSAPSIVQVAASIGAGSHIAFFAGSTGECIALTVDNSSKWKPMVP
jgi:hypothetical protein